MSVFGSRGTGGFDEYFGMLASGAVLQQVDVLVSDSEYFPSNARQGKEVSLAAPLLVSHKVPSSYFDPAPPIPESTPLQTKPASR